MTVVHVLDTLTEWARREICPKIELKIPPADEKEANDAGYEYRRANPVAFAMYVPTKEKLPPGILSPIPSVCVRFLEGTDDMTNSTGNIGVQMCFSTWNPGTHGKDVILPNQENAMEPKQWTGPEADAYFRRHGEGWRDVWNFVDIARREIERVTNIDGILVDRATPVKYGPLTEQEAIPDFYPLWFAWVSFAVKFNNTRAINGVEKFL